MPGVEGASVNFAAEKLTVKGYITESQIEQAGAFDQITVKHADKKNDEPAFLTKKKWIQVGIAAVFVLAGWGSHFLNGETHTITVLLFFLAIMIGGYDLFAQGLKNLRSFIFDMKTLMTVAVIGAALIGEWGEGALVVVLFAVSEALESYSMDQARRSLRTIMKQRPEEATVVRGESTFSVPVSAVEPGEKLVVLSGEQIPLDGEVTEGRSAVNEAAITGESMPQIKKSGDHVYAGSLNEEGVLYVEATKKAADSKLAKIIHLVEEAQAEKAPAQKFVDRFAYYYTPAIILLAFLIMIIPPLIFGASWNEWVYLGLATLVVGCPCALVISTPVAIVTAIGTAAKNGVLIKGGVYLEEWSRLNTIAFDKTGTLTKGEPEVSDFLPVDQSNGADVLRYTAALEAYSTHPLAKAVVNYASSTHEQADHLLVENVETHLGKGVEGYVNGSCIRAGNPHWIQEILPQAWSSEVDALVDSLQKDGKTTVIAVIDERVAGVFALQDSLREDAAALMQDLAELKINKRVLLTGDQKVSAEAISNGLGLTDVYAEMMPEDKLTELERLASNRNKVAMVGDGINDAPALAKADIGIAMGAGTDTALETADTALMKNDLSQIPKTIRLSRKTMRIIKQNILFALGLKAFALLLVPFGLLTLWIAIVADMGATLLVTLNSLRLLRQRKTREYGTEKSLRPKLS
ncbi:Cd2+/Zn2+-exporting ATPase [Salisediminibacterium halotolerans]|uniref:Cd(2+)-exporting ATPase n=2 Tax=Salisediminibacterium halotolerans TaxID=517425 RepID=A0A1H9SN25_9BACI|nr:Cd2+/Zn2+-exporting ATPase [Salisediminibacterium haloalkalitolerans]